jgi:hypothetical protein
MRETTSINDVWLTRQLASRWGCAPPSAKSEVISPGHEASAARSKHAPAWAKLRERAGKFGGGWTSPRLASHEGRAVAVAAAGPVFDPGAVVLRGRSLGPGPGRLRLTATATCTLSHRDLTERAGRPVDPLGCECGSWSSRLWLLAAYATVRSGPGAGCSWRAQPSGRGQVQVAVAVKRRRPGPGPGRG